MTTLTDGCPDLLELTGWKARRLHEETGLSLSMAEKLVAGRVPWTLNTAILLHDAVRRHRAALGAFVPPTTAERLAAEAEALDRAADQVVGIDEDGRAALRAHAKRLRGEGLHAVVQRPRKRALPATTPEQADAIERGEGSLTDDLDQRLTAAEQLDAAGAELLGYDVRHAGRAKHKHAQPYTDSDPRAVAWARGRAVALGEIEARIGRFSGALNMLGHRQGEVNE